MPIDAFAADHFSIGIPAEVDLVGLAFGVRPELLWRPFDAEGAAELRFAVGVAVGPELAFVPIDLGVRAHWFPRKTVHPITGLGGEVQTIHAAHIASVVRPAVYVELGVDVDVSAAWSVGVLAEVDFAPPPAFGLGGVARVGVTRDF